ncbi:hypothetical protein V6N13_051183 [Hibiscus sabdariffa]|uniref:Uncharacterized protein n=1 Tax=Hibiscus sabdariffa TaxID=183260 RepID=A0ABR2T2T8_9ROSI
MGGANDSKQEVGGQKALHPGAVIPMTTRLGCFNTAFPHPSFSSFRLQLGAMPSPPRINPFVCSNYHLFGRRTLYRIFFDQTFIGRHLLF